MSTAPPPNPADGIRDRLRTDMVRGSLWTLLASVLATPAVFAANLVVVRSLHTAQFATYALHIAAFTIALTVINVGVTDATTQWLAAAYARGEAADAEAIARRCAGFHLLVKAPLIVLVTLAILHGAPSTFMLVAVAANVGFMALDTANVILVSTAANARLAQVTLVMTLATQCALASGAVAEHTAAATWALRCAGLFVGPLLGLIALPAEQRRWVLSPRLPRRLPSGFVTYAMAAWSGALVATLLFDRTEIFVLRWHHDLSAVALFAVTTTVANQLTVPMDSLMAPLNSISAGLVASAPERSAAALERTLRVDALSGSITCAVVLPATIALLGSVFGHGYGRGGPALCALGIVSCLSSTAAPLRAFALATRSAARVLRINAVCLVVDVALALALIPPWGLTGAVVALAVGQALAVVLLLGLIARRLERRPRELLVAMRTFAVGPVGLAAALGLAAIGTEPVVRAVIAAVTGIAVLLTALRAIPALRLPAEDAVLIEAGLPPRLRRMFSWLGRSCCLVQPART